MDHDIPSSQHQTPSITFADDAKLVAMIERAEERVLLLSPGVSDTVAEAIERAWERLGPDAVTVILDVDPEVFRLGFGTLEAVERLRSAAAAAGTMVHHQPGVRIGLLVCDSQTLVFSPPPLLVEAGSTQPQRPNAIELGPVPARVARDLGLGASPDAQRVVGLDPVRGDQIEQVKADLAAAPPAKFDLARQVRVFTSRFQFVEFSMVGCALSRNRVAIPASLVGLARTANVERQFHAQFDLLHKCAVAVKSTRHSGLITEATLKEMRRDIERRFLVPLTGYGMILLRANRQRFEAAVDELRDEVKTFAEGASEQIDKLIATSSAVVTAALLPAVIRNPPDHYRKLCGPRPSNDYLAGRLREDIDTAFGTAKALTDKMEVKLIFKDLTYESLNDPKFHEIARRAMPGVDGLHTEFDASKGPDRPTPSLFSGG